MTKERKRRSTRAQWWLRLSLSIVIGAGFVFALVRRIQFIPDDPWLAPWVLPVYLLTLVGYFVFRAGRWHYLVEPLAEVPLETTLTVSMAGTMWIMVLPLRLGEFARPIFLAEKSEVTMSQALGTVAIERIVDGLVVCGLFFACLPLLPEVSGEQAKAVAELRAAGLVATGGLAAVLVVLIAMALAPDSVGRLVSATLGRVVPPMADKLEGLARGLAEGLAALPSFGALFKFLAGTLAYWAFNALGTWLLARGCGLDLSLAEASAVMAVLGISLLLPGGPGQLGIFHTGLLLGLSMFATEAIILDRGSVFIFWMFVTQLSMGVLLGILAQRRLDLDWRRAFGLSAEADTEPDPAPGPAPDPASIDG